ncbi:MAG: RNA pyrophosphohydrolase [Gammaproteobacteria bacterium]|nr:RNA pyrophosphohydrolase [Gammaproteobacteria bacterium]
MIDADGFRPNVGIILVSPGGQLFWARRVGQDAWQFPQGGIRRHETPEEALYRELYEEVGLTPEHVEVVGSTRGWLRYRLPERFIRRHRRPLCVGQKQRWYILRFLGAESDVCLSRAERPEFDHWRWVDYWDPLREVVFFKRRVYRRALEELAPLVGRDPLPATDHSPTDLPVAPVPDPGASPVQPTR